jgi:mannosylfructose-phosphate synthase
MGYQVDVMTRLFDGQPASEPLSEQVRILRFPCGGPDFIRKEALWERIPEWVEHAARFIRAQELCYSFINSHYWDAGMAGNALSRILGIPHLHTPHSIGSWKRDNMHGDPSEMERRYNFRRRIREEKEIYRAADMLISTTAQQLEILAAPEYGAPREKIRVIPPGYDDMRFFPVSAATRLALKKELDAEGPIVLALGRIARNKGYDLLLRAMPVVFARVKDARLILAVGSTEPTEAETRQVEELEKLARALGIADRVLFRGYIPDASLADYYRVADVFALSSRYEPFGMTAIEAMACGTPAVVTTEGGLWEEMAWGLDVLYANPLDPEAFGHAICQVLQHAEVSAQLAKHGSESARSRFTWTGVAQQILASIGDHALRPSPGADPRSDSPSATMMRT